MFAQRGYSLLLLLFWTAAIGLVLTTTAQVWTTTSLRSKEQELLFVGDQFKQAIATYYSRNINPGARYPKSLEDLLDDPGQPLLARYLRRIYLDPVTGKRDWGLVHTSDGRIMGVYSLAKGEPLKTDHFPAEYAEFAGKQTYADWKFVYVEGGGTATQAAQGTQISANPAQPSAVAPPLQANSPDVPPAVVSQPSLPADRRKQDCTKLQATDASMCENERIKWGSAQECLDSAQLRASACAGGQAVPPLFIRYK